jgi:CheY-like chemotaxis protein
MRIALIEHHSGDARWFHLTLAEIGREHNLAVFSRGADALAFFRRSSPPDLIVTSDRFPTSNFQDFVENVRAIPIYEATPIAVITGMAYLIRKEVVAQGAIGCLEKPIDTGALLAILNRIDCSLTMNSHVPFRKLSSLPERRAL